jgi:ParB-like chromosome segregation protein Spo0J
LAHGRRLPCAWRWRPFGAGIGKALGEQGAGAGAERRVCPLDDQAVAEPGIEAAGGLGVYEALVKSMENNGLQEPIVTYQDAILDGCNRYRACIDAKVAPRYEEFKGTDEEALAFVIVENLDRRHLTPSQLACVGAKIATMKRGSPGLSQIGQLAHLDQSEAAEKLSVSARSIKRATSDSLRLGDGETMSKRVSGTAGLIVKACRSQSSQYPRSDRGN